MNNPLPTYWRELASGTRRRFWDRLIVSALIPPALLYTLIQSVRSICYRIGWLQTKRLPRPVISIGNLTVGGTGKTPMTIYLAGLLMSRGLRVAVLSRGYGGNLEGHTAVVSDGTQIFLSAEQCGDEPYLLATSLPGLMVIIGPDRYQAGMLAMERLAPDLFVLDDGFQHLKLYRDLNIVLLNARYPLGNGWTLPAGLLREPASTLERADLVIWTRCSPPPPVVEMNATPACTSQHRIVDFIPLGGGPPLDPDSLSGAPVVAFAGIAEPELFFDELRTLGLEVVDSLGLSDHACYDAPLLSRIAEVVMSPDVAYAVTTEKDGVKLQQLPPELRPRILLARLAIDVHNPGILQNMLSNLLSK